jgi:hypothetical protein
MKAAGKTYEPVIYPDPGHGFMRLGEAPTPRRRTKPPARKPGNA